MAESVTVNFISNKRPIGNTEYSLWVSGQLTFFTKSQKIKIMPWSDLKEEGMIMVEYIHTLHCSYF
jgi:hypothetical protein